MTKKQMEKEDEKVSFELRRLAAVHRVAGDTELVHILGDDQLLALLTRLGFTRTVAAFNDLERWYA